MNDILDWCQGDRFWLKYFKNELRKEKIIKIFFDDLRNFDKINEVENKS